MRFRAGRQDAAGYGSQDGRRYGSRAHECGNELANLEWLPQPLNRAKSNSVGPRQLAHAQRLLEAHLLSPESFDRLKRQAHDS